MVRFLTIVKFDPEAFRMFPHNFEKSKCRKFPQATRKSANICVVDTKDGLQPEEIRFFHSRKNKEIYVLSEQFFYWPTPESGKWKNKKARKWRQNKRKQTDTQSNLAKGLPSSIYVLRTAVYMTLYT